MSEQYDDIGAFEEEAYQIFSKASDPREAKEELLKAYYSGKYNPEEARDTLNFYGQAIDQEMGKRESMSIKDIEDITGYSIFDFIKDPENDKPADVVTRWEETIRNVLQTETSPELDLRKNSIIRDLPELASEARRYYNNELYVDPENREIPWWVKYPKDALMRFSSGAGNFLGMATWLGTAKRFLGETGYDYRRSKLEFTDPTLDGSWYDAFTQGAGQVGGIVASAALGGPLGAAASIYPQGAEEVIKRGIDTYDETGSVVQTAKAVGLETISQGVQIFADRYLGGISKKLSTLERARPKTMGAIYEAGSEGIGTYISGAAENIEEKRGVMDYEEGIHYQALKGAVVGGALGPLAIKALENKNIRKEEADMYGEPITPQDVQKVGINSTVEGDIPLNIDKIDSVATTKDSSEYFIDSTGTQYSITDDGRIEIKFLNNVDATGSFDNYVIIPETIAEDITKKVLVDKTHEVRFIDEANYLVDKTTGEQTEIKGTELPTKDSYALMTSQSYEPNNQTKVHPMHLTKIIDTSLGAMGPSIEMPTRESRVKSRLQEATSEILAQTGESVDFTYIVPTREGLLDEADRYINTQGFQNVFDRMIKGENFGTADLTAGVYVKMRQHISNQLLNLSEEARVTGDDTKYQAALKLSDYFHQNTFEPYNTRFGRAVDILRTPYETADIYKQEFEASFPIEDQIELDNTSKELETLNQELETVSQIEDSVNQEKVRQLDTKIEKLKESKSDKAKQKLDSLVKEKNSLESKPSARRINLEKELAKLQSKQEKLALKRQNAVKKAAEKQNNLSATAKKIRELSELKMTLPEQSPLRNNIDQEINILKEKEQFVAGLLTKEGVYSRLQKLSRSNALTGTLGALGIIPGITSTILGKFALGATGVSALRLMQNLGIVVDNLIKGTKTEYKKIPSFEIVKDLLAPITSPVYREFLKKRVKIAVTSGDVMQAPVDFNTISGADPTYKGDRSEFLFRPGSTDYYNYVKELEAYNKRIDQYNKEFGSQIQKSGIASYPKRLVESTLSTLESGYKYLGLLTRTYGIIDSLTGIVDKSLLNLTASEAYNRGEITKDQYKTITDYSKQRYQNALKKALSQKKVLESQGIKVSDKDLFKQLYFNFYSQIPQSTLLDFTKLQGEMTYLTPVDGISGQIARSVGDLIQNTQYVGPAIFFYGSMFLNASMRFIQQNMHNIPIVGNLTAKTKGKTPFQTTMQHSQSIMSLVAMGAIYAAIEDQEDPYIDIISRYSTDKTKQAEFLSKKGKFDSIKIGRGDDAIYVPFVNTAFAAPFSIIGGIRDAKRSGKEMPLATSAMLGGALFQGLSFFENALMFQQLGNMYSFIKEFSRSEFSSEAAAAKLIKGVLAPAKNLTVSPSIVRNIMRMSTDPVAANKHIQSAIFENIPYFHSEAGLPALNIIGEVLGPDTGMYRLYTKTTPDLDFRWLAETGYKIPDYARMDDRKIFEDIDVSFEDKHKAAQNAAPVMREFLKSLRKQIDYGKATPERQKNLSRKINNIWATSLADVLQKRGVKFFSEGTP